MDLDSARSVRGYCWFVAPERPTVAGVLPFGKVAAHGADPTAEVPQSPPGVEGYWALGGNTIGIGNRMRARSYLVVTATDAPPGVNPGWAVEPARLGDDFQIDQGGSRWVHLIRAVGVAGGPCGPVPIAEFEAVGV